MLDMVAFLITGVRRVREARSWRVVPSLVMAAALGLMLQQAGVSAPAATGQIEGTIASVEPGVVTLTPRTGNPVHVLVTAETQIIQRKPVALESIRPNDVVGVTARREADGSLTAISINIFPPEFKDRIRQAQFVMETGNIMTNAAVFQNVRRIEGRTLYLKLGDGSVVIAVPKDAAVLRLTLGKITDLKPGMQVVVRGAAAADGGLTAATITVDLR